MGLDMYLSKRTYVQRWDHQSEDGKFLVTVTRGGKPLDSIKPERVSYVIEQVGYWRKANAIHQWFVERVQDGKDECKETYVPREALEELLATVKEVLADPKDKADVLLPTQSGFFFGSTEYDVWYIKHLESTVEILEAALAESDTGSFYYCSSW